MASTHVYRAMEIAPLTVIPYKPKPQKPSNHNIRNHHPKPSVRQPSRLNISQIVDSGESAETPLFESSGLEKKVGDCVAAARDAVSSGDDPESARAGSTKHASAPAARYDSDNEFDDELPSLRRLLSPEYRHKLAEEGLLQESTVGENNNQALDDALFGYGSAAGSSQDEPIVLESDGRSEHEGENLDNTHALRIVDGEPLDHNALDLDIVPAAFNPSAQTLEYSDNNSNDNGIDNNTFPRLTKRQRSTSPHCEPNLRRTNTTPPPHNEDVESSTENADGSDSAESGEDNLLSKRRKLSDSLGGSTALNGHSGRSQHSPSSIPEDPEDDGGDGSESVSVDDNFASTARTTPDVFDSASLTETQMCPEVTETNRDWEILKIIGKEYVNGVLHYMVKWCPTLEPVHSLEHAKELVDEFEARLKALRKGKGRRVEPGVKRDGQSGMGADVPGQQPKRPRGRPRKQK